MKQVHSIINKVLFHRSVIVQISAPAYATLLGCNRQILSHTWRLKDLWGHHTASGALWLILQLTALGKFIKDGTLFHFCICNSW